MIAIILAAGYGVRLYPLTKNCPKPLLQVANKPILNYTVENLVKVKQINKIFIVSNDKFYENYQRWLKSLHFTDIQIQILNDGSTNNNNRLGAVKDLAWCIKSQNLNAPLLVIAGDNLYTFNLNAMLDFFEAKKGNVVAVTDLKSTVNIKNYGVVEFDKNFKITNFIEKPPYSNITTIAIGIYIFLPTITGFLEQYLEEKNNPDAPGYFLEWLHKKDEIYAFTFQETWFDIGDIDSYRQAKKFFEERNSL
ncbi:MAG: nucleotidyltransferase family protein [Planctomycetota bacterium]